MNSGWDVARDVPPGAPPRDLGGVCDDVPPRYEPAKRR
jgi:hypothetical protein